MTDYSSIKGNRIQYLDSDPTLSSANEGQVWYNNATGALKGLVQIKAWSSGANVPTNIRNHMGTGPSTAGVIFGGYNPPITAITTALEYSGYSYSTGGTINTPSRSLAGSGASQTSALKIMGQTEPFSVDVGITNTESYDGSTWTTVNSANTKRFAIGGSGTQTSSIVLGGRDDPADRGTSFEEYDGTSWATGTSPPLSKSNTGVWGDSTAALVFGGNTPAVPPGTTQNTTQDWNGTAWTSVSNMINNAFNNASNCGDSGSGVKANSTGSEEWDGQIWSTIPAMTSARNGCGGGDNSNIWIGGAPPGLNLTEEYNSTIFSPATGAWASGGNLSTARSAGASAGTQTEALYTGGNTGSYVATTEEYNGTSWGPGGNLNTARGYTAGAGTQTSAVVFGGFTPSSPTFSTTATEEYDGSAWTSNPTGLGTARYGLAGCGTQTSALAFGGTASPGNQTEEYDGSTWTTGGNLNTARKYLAGCGTQTAGLAVGGNPSSPVVTGATEEYDGSAWTSNPTGLNSSRGSGLGTAGTITSAVAFGGLLTAPAPGTGTTATELYDGSNWVSAPSMTTGRYFIGNAGSASAGLAFGGRNAPARNANTEEWSGPQTTATASTLTTS
jgi:hypothetical protein